MAKADQMSTAATEPQVPGPGLPKPEPKKVAMIHAHHFVAFLFWTGGVEGSVVIAVLAVAAGQVAQIFKDLGVEDGRTDPVDTGGPLSEIDLAAAVAAEGKIFGVHLHQHAASGAAEELSGFLLWGHGRVPAWGIRSLNMLPREGLPQALTLVYAVQTSIGGHNCVRRKTKQYAGFDCLCTGSSCINGNMARDVRVAAGGAGRDVYIFWAFGRSGHAAGSGGYAGVVDVLLLAWLWAWWHWPLSREA